jgi:pimeloyl-ACP methyl ester carboxylesterase
MGWLCLAATMLACNLPVRWAAGRSTATPAESGARPAATLTPFAPVLPPQPTSTQPQPEGQATAAQVTPATPADQAGFEPADCMFAVPGGQSPECGYLVVPENRARAGNTLRLAVAVFRSTAVREAGAPVPAPVVYLSGGPGSGALELAGYLFQVGLRAVLETCDLVLFDQRGTGFSTPRLDCPERQALAAELLARGLSAPENQDRVAQAFAQCRERLVGQGIDLSAYTSAASAADLADLARVLGYPAVDLYAVSYGTRLALTVLRDQPGLVQRAVLDSTLPPQANLYSELPGNAERAFNAFFSENQTEYPGLKDDFYALVDRLNANPTVLRVVTSGQEVGVRLDGGLMIDVLLVGLYNPAVTARMPALIYAVAAGDYTALRERVALYFDEGVALGMQMAVQCNEELPFVSAEDIVARTAGVQPQIGAFYSATMRALLAGCAGWSPAAPDPRENQAVNSSVPVLILAGSHDPITPPAWGRLAQLSLPNAEFHEFAGHGHWVTRSSAEAMQLALDFWNQ